MGCVLVSGRRPVPGLRGIPDRKVVGEDRNRLALLGVSGAFIFVLSSLKLPSVTGSCSHPAGTGLSAALFGPAVTSVLSAIVLLYQALFLAHGGLTTFGANVVSMGIAGLIVGNAIFRADQRTNLKLSATVFATAMMADPVTYVVTWLQLALALPRRADASQPLLPRSQGSSG